MRHPYVADVGDFGKYGLLRAICRDNRDTRLGVVWYLTDAHEHNNDGKHDGYLKRGSDRRRAAYRDCDPELYDRMKEIRELDQLSVEMLQDGVVLPQNTKFYSEPVPSFHGRVRYREDQEQRWRTRDEWHDRAVASVADANCVFTDPDNGLTFSDRQQLRRRKPSHKHSFWHEIADYLAKGKSVVAYHHMARQKGGHEKHITDRLVQLKSLGFPGWALHFRRGTARAFLVIPSQTHLDAFWESTQRFAERWSRHGALLTIEQCVAV